MPWLTVPRHHRAFALALLICVERLWAAQPSPRAQTEEELINWYYASVFGTGLYASGDRKVGVLQLPFSHELRTAEQSSWGLRLKLPVTFGFYDFAGEDLAGGRLPESLGTLSVLPGLEADIPVLHNWLLQPSAQLGAGWELDGSDSALIYSLGLKSRLTFPLARSRFMLGNQLLQAAYRPSDNVTRPIGLFVTGLNLFYPTGGQIAGRAADVGLHVIHYTYFNRMEFPLIQNAENKIRDEAEIAFSVSVRSPLAFGLFDLDMIGIAIRAGEDLRGIRLFFGLPY